jgi:hypothetical protein
MNYSTLCFLLASNILIASVSAAIQDFWCGDTGYLNTVEQQQIYPCRGQVKAKEACDNFNTYGGIQCLSYAVDRANDVCYLYSGTAYNTMDQIKNLDDGWTQQYYDITCRIPTMCNIRNALNQVELQEVYPCDGQAAAQTACAAADSCSFYGVGNNVCFLYSRNAFDTMTDTNNLYPGWSLQYVDLALL